MRLKVNIYAILLAACGLLSMQACEKVEAEDIVYEEKSRTILLYMVSNNDLAPTAVSNIRKILKGYIPTDGNLAIYCNDFDLSTGRMNGTSTLLVNLYKDESGTIVRDTIIPKFPARNSATKAQLLSVMNIVRTALPAKEYGLVFWSHGTGWLPSGYYSANHEDEEQSEAIYSNSICPDDAAYGERLEALRKQRRLSGGVSGIRHEWPSAPGGIDPYAHMVKSFGREEGVEMPITDLASAIPYKMDFIAFDACLMGGIEVAYQLKDLCDYFIASPAEILTEGFPYGNIMEKFFKADYTGAAEAVYDSYEAQAGQFHSVTISVVKTSELDAVADAAKDVFAKYRSAIDTLDVSKIQPYFRYDKHWFYDIKNFMDRLAGADAAAFDEALENAVIAKFTTGRMINIDIDPERFSGVSTYINNPANNTLDAYYQSLKWDKAVFMISPPAE